MRRLVSLVSLMFRFGRRVRYQKIYVPSGTVLQFNGSRAPSSLDIEVSDALKYVNGATHRVLTLHDARALDEDDGPPQWEKS